MEGAENNFIYLPNLSFYKTEFIPGTAFSCDIKSPGKPFIASFEDDGQKAYFFAADERRPEKPIRDARLIYEVSTLSDSLKKKKTQLTILWDAESVRALLLLDSHPHAFFDFKIEKAYCQTGKPFITTWLQDDFHWQDRVLKFFVKNA